MSQPSPTIDESVRGMQIIAGALVAGVVMFSLIAVLAVGALAEPSSGMIVSLVGAFFGVGAFVMHLVVPGIMVRQLSGGRSTSDPDYLCGVYQTKLIVGLAILEVAAFLNVITTIIEHNWWSLGIAGLLVFWMLAAFPTKTRVEHWIETQRMLAE